MALKFNCSFCGNEIFVRNLKVGEMALCRNCLKKNEIPAIAIPFNEAPPREQPKAPPEIPPKVQAVTAPAREQEIIMEPAKTELESDTKETAGRIITADALKLGISAQTMENINTTFMKPLEGMAKAIYIFALMIMILIVMAFISDFEVYNILKAVAAGKSILSISRANSIGNRQELISYTLTFINLPFMILFIAWFYNAHRNLKRANVPLMKYSSGWTIGGFFVPFLNFIRPLQMMLETWTGSALISGETHYDPFGKKPWNRKIASWWYIFIFAGSFRLRAALRSFRAESAKDLIGPTLMSIANEVLLFIDIIILIYLVKKITDYQSNARKMAYIKSSAK